MNKESRLVLMATGGLVLLCVLIVLSIAATAQAQGPDSETIKGWLDSPAILYGLMLLGSLASALKQFSVAKMSDIELTLAKYFSFAQEGAVTLITNTLAFAALIHADQLNFASAVAIGYVSNSVADLLPSGTRSDAVGNVK